MLQTISALSTARVVGRILKQRVAGRCGCEQHSFSSLFRFVVLRNRTGADYGVHQRTQTRTLNQLKPMVTVAQSHLDSAMLIMYSKPKEGKSRLGGHQPSAKLAKRHFSASTVLPEKVEIGAAEETSV